MQKAKELYFYILVLKNSTLSKIDDQLLKAYFTGINTGKIKTFIIYKSLRADSDYIIWCTADEPESFLFSYGRRYQSFDLDIG